MANIQLLTSPAKSGSAQQRTATLSIEGVSYTLDLDQGSITGYTGGPIKFKVTPVLPRQHEWRLRLALLYWRKRIIDGGAGFVLAWTLA